MVHLGVENAAFTPVIMETIHAVLLPLEVFDSLNGWLGSRVEMRSSEMRRMLLFSLLHFLSADYPITYL